MIANRYSLEREIGRGGMGAVWLGRDELLGRAVAVKRIGRAPGADQDREGDQQRAEREARIAASLNHPHVVAVFDLVEEDEDQWLVMEYVEGRSLSQMVRDEGPLSVDQAAVVLADAAAALATAHAEGVVHRDVKPSNILLTTAGEAKLLDFGIARAQGDLTLTQTGLVSGSPAYLAPEVASGLPATTASDVWSLGATLFHLLTGRPPYDVGGNIVGGLYRIVHEEPPVVPDPGWLEPLLAATMVRDPDQRWSMAHVASFLESGPRTAAATPEDPERTRVVTALAPVAAGAAAGTAAGGRPAATTDRPAPNDAAAPPGGTGSSAAAASAPRRGRGAVVALAALVLALLVAVVLLVWQPDDEQAAPPVDSTAPSASPSSPTPSEDRDPTRDPRPAAEPTEEGIRSFVTDYLRTAATDPDAGFAMLTPSFQQASGGLSGYTGFWGQVTSVSDIEFTEVDPESLTVGYTYTYRTANGGPTTGDVALELAYDPAADRYLIADEA